MSLSPEHLSDLKLSGLSDDMIEKAGLYSVSSCDIPKILGKGYADRVDSLLAFPYRGNGFCRFKLFPPIKDKDGHKVKYFQPSGSGVHLYYPPNVFDDVANPNVPLFLVEGEKKALKGAQEGITSLGLGGIWSFKEKDRDELAPGFANVPLKNRVVNIIPDGDYHTNKSIQKAVLTLAEKLKQKGAIPYLISLPDGKEKIGLDDFLTQFGIADFWDLPREEIKTDPYERLNLPSSFEISEMDVHVEWLVTNLIPKESITLLHSIGGVGKTYLLLSLGRSVAEGGTFFGLDVMKLPVYYVDFENPLPEISDRLKKIGGSKNLLIWHLGHDPGPVRFDDGDWEIYKAFPRGLFIIDSLRSAHLLEENSSRDAAIVMARLKEIRARGNTIILIHHENKVGGYRGSTAWFDLSDHILKFSRVRAIGSDEDAAGEDFDLPIRLGLGGKSRFSSAMDLKPMFFKFEDHRLCLAEDPDIKTLRQIADYVGEGIYYNELFREVQADIELMVGEKKMGKSRFDRLVNKGVLSVPPMWKKREVADRGKIRTRFFRAD